METKDKKTKKIKVRGVGTYNPADNSFGFEPFNEGPSTQTDVKNCLGGGKSWITTGTDPSRMVSLKCKASSADPYSDLVTQFNQLTRDLKPEKPVTLPDNLRVVKENGLECWLDEEKNEMTFTGRIDLSRQLLVLSDGEGHEIRLNTSKPVLKSYKASILNVKNKNE